MPANARTARSQRYEGTDRQCRGAVLAVLRAASEPVPASALETCWPDPEQRARVVTALIADGLASAYSGDLVGLPGDHPQRGPQRVAGDPVD